MLQLIATQQQSALPMIAMWVLIGLIFWFFIFRPQRKRQKEIQNFRSSIAVGSRVVTAGGIHGEVRAIDETANVLIVEIAKGVNIRVDRNSVYATAQTEQNR